MNPIRHSLVCAIIIFLFALVLSVPSAQSMDILEFTDIPGPPNFQAILGIALACQNGVHFGFHAIDDHATMDGQPRPWDISFDNGSVPLVIHEYPLVLAKAPSPLMHDGRAYAFEKYSTLLWKEEIPAGRLATCIAGAGSGFCQFPTEIHDCRISPELVVDIVQIGPSSASPRVAEQLVFEVRAYDPQVGTTNGAGIESVEFKIIDYASGTEVYSQMTPPASETDDARFCAFGETCAPWVFARNANTWPGGEPIHNGTYLLRAIAYAPGERRMVTEQHIQIDPSPQPDYVFIPGGEFTMGTEGGNPQEQPAHPVVVEDFWIMRTEVTNGQYAECVRGYACTRPQGERWRAPNFVDHPVTNVTWDQANQYATWAGGRLPTEAEWEKACRSDDGRLYPWGEAPPTNEVANYNNSLGDTVSVGSLPGGASPYGALDMSGNVWEWTSSVSTPYPYAADDGREGRRSADDRAVRGGSYYYTQYQLTCSARAHLDPDKADPQYGFRIVVDEEPAMRSVRFVSPVDGATVPTSFEVVMQAEGLTVEPAGQINPGAGHFHILIDTDFLVPGDLIPFDDNHLHFGKGQLSTTLELAPGEHTLRLQFANGGHYGLPGAEFRNEINVTVVD